MATAIDASAARAFTVLAAMLALGGCVEEEIAPPGSKRPCRTSPPTGCPEEARYCCTMEDSVDTYCVAEPLLGDEWICGFDPITGP